MRIDNFLQARVCFAVAFAFVCCAEICASEDQSAVGRVLRIVNERLEREFMSHDGLLLDYVGEIPTPKDIVDLRPNAMGWWCPIENGSMFTGEWLPALMREGKHRSYLVERCVKGLIKMSEVSDVPGFIARGTATDLKSHHPCGSNDQTDPWFLGLIEYCRWEFADPTLKKCALDRLVVTAKALEKNGWRIPCDGPFKGQNRGYMLSKKMPFWAIPRFMYMLKSLYDLTGDEHWGDLFEDIKAKRLAEIERGAEIDVKTFKQAYGSCVWIYLSSAQTLERLIRYETNAVHRKKMEKGFRNFASRIAPLMKNRAAYDNSIQERPFKYANWRTGYKWQEQKTQKDAQKVAFSPIREILGNRKAYERNGMANPLTSAAICALQGDERFKDEIVATLLHYDYSTPNISEFFHAAIAAAAILDRE